MNRSGVPIQIWFEQERFMEWSCTELSAGDERNQMMTRSLNAALQNMPLFCDEGEATEDFDTEEGPNQMHTLGRKLQANWKI